MLRFGRGTFPEVRVRTTNCKSASLHTTPCIVELLQLLYPHLSSSDSRGIRGSLRILMHDMAPVSFASFGISRRSSGHTYGIHKLLGDLYRSWSALFQPLFPHPHQRGFFQASHRGPDCMPVPSLSDEYTTYHSSDSHIVGFIGLCPWKSLYPRDHGANRCRSKAAYLSTTARYPSQQPYTART